MQYSNYKALYNTLFELQRIAGDYDVLLFNKEQGWPNSTVKSAETQEKFEQTIFELTRELPKYLPGLLSELHINAIEDPSRCDKYITDLLQLLSRHLTHAQRTAVRIRGEEVSSPEFDPMFGNHNLLFYSEMLEIKKPSYSELCILRWAAIDYLLTIFQRESEYRLSDSYYEILPENQSPQEDLSNVDAIKADSINEKLIFFKESGIYKLLYDLSGENKESVARWIAYLIDGQPNTIAPLLVKIEYKKQVPTPKDPDLKAAKKNNPYTNKAIMRAYEVLLRFRIKPSTELKNAYETLIDSKRN